MKFGALTEIEDMVAPENNGQFELAGIKKRFKSYKLRGWMDCMLERHRGIAFLGLILQVQAYGTPDIDPCT